MSQVIGPLWTKQAKLEGGLDPLGLDRVSDRLTAELMPGMSVNVNMARYFSFFSWLFEMGKSDDQNQLLDEIVRAEKVYALSTYLVHEGISCATGVAGGETAAKIWDVNKQINLDKVNWLSNGGVYLGLYKGPLLKMGVLKTDSKGRVTVTKTGRPLAEAFHRAVSFTDWARNGRSRSIVTRAELKQFGNQACPCSLKSSPTELNALRQLFFDTPTLGGRTLGQSFGFILSLIDQCEPYEFENLNQSFRLAMYYRKVYTDQDRVVRFKVLNSLNETVTRWRSFQAHDYFSFALESFLSIWLEVMFVHPGQRLTLPQFLECMDNKEFFTALKSHLGSRFSDTSLRELKLERLFLALLKKAELSGFSEQNSVAFDRAVGLEHDLSEQNLSDQIWARYLEGRQYAARCVEALMLLLVLYTRFYHQHLQGLNQPGWDRYIAASSQSESDLGLPRFYWMYPLEELLPMSVYDFLVRVLNHNVIQQALTMREERRRDLIWFSEAGFSGLGQVAPLTQTYQYHYSFDNYRTYRNTSKLNNALAMMSDIEYVTNKGGFWQLTREGRKRLQKSFGAE